VIYQLGSFLPKIDYASSFIAPSADIIGQVELGRQVSIWFNAVIRGDTDRITVGDQCNIQDGAVLHTDPGFHLQLARGVTVGHKAMLHGCEIGEFSLIGINSVVLNGAKIGHHTLIAANTLITEGKEIASGVLVMGNPGKIVRELTKQEQEKLELSAEIYTNKIQQYRELIASAK
jgi:carbonic anhydrase/acetyltransferase-like protein (isoleucine patch superfamily)